MATDVIISGKDSFTPLLLNTYFIDAGAIYKRLFNHRPVVQNEVHYFVQEFEVITHYKYDM